ncbi:MULTISPECIES: hypothetical protein [unclassified Nocardioides]|uniref:hypothetical protein n=1 Tax=unclassified Nocardioides TaxID=2615069 RepID=UPI003605D4F2
MVVFAVMVVVGIVAATVFVVVFLREWGQSVARTEAELHQPGARTISYAVPPGRDPADFAAVLHQRGYLVVEEEPGRLLIGCPQVDDPEKVRQLLEQA